MPFANFRRIANPDFYLPDYDEYIEYWGLVNAKDDRKREEYVRTMKWKMAQYYQNKIAFISLHPDNLDNLDWIFQRKSKEATGIDLQKK